MEDRNAAISDRMLVGIVAVTVLGLGLGLLMLRAWSAIGAFFDGLAAIASVLGATVGVAAIAVVILGVYYVKERMRVDIARRDILARTFTPEIQSGNMPAYFDTKSMSFYQPENGTPVQVVPQTYSPHVVYQIKNDTPIPLALPAGPSTSSSKPRVDDLVKMVERNSFEIALGKSLINDGETVIVCVEDVHIKIIGASRKGKSCLAAAILDMAIQMHDPNVLTVALLDMENKTSKLFAESDHIARVESGRESVSLHARNPVEVSEHLHLIRNEMDRRYALTEQEQEEQTHMLVYIEEFLSLKRHASLNKKQIEMLIGDLNELAIRGLKAHIHLLCCAQVDYADEDLKAFANNFGLNISFSVRPEAARAAGFVCSDLLKQNYQGKVPGQAVVEGTGCTDLVVAPEYDVKAKLRTLGGSKPGRNRVETSSRNESEPALQASLETKLLQAMEVPGETMVETLKRVWDVRPGDSDGYRQAKEEYIQVLQVINAMARRGMEV